MAVTRNSRSIIMTADNDAVLGRLLVTEMYLALDGATASATFSITETGGAVLGQGGLQSTDGRQDIITVPKWVDGIVAETLPANATVVVLYA
jgi:hypothetical protein